MNWKEEVEKRKEEIVKQTQTFLQIKSVLDEASRSKVAPFGEGINEALLHLLQMGEDAGFTVKNLDGYAGHIELTGSSEEIVGILCHIDVVPEGDGWSSDPFGAEIRDGKIFARGALDDKGPTIAAFYAMKILKELNLPLSKPVRMIIGTDEESEWRCVEHYFKHEKMPIMGFAPDADFPIIFAEKGIIDATLIQTSNVETISSDVVLQAFHSGRRFNMVPDFAQATIQINQDGGAESVVDSFNNYIAEQKVKGTSKVEGKTVTFSIEGISAHAMEPNNGVNAGLLIALFLTKLNLDQKGNEFIQTIATLFEGDTRGNNLHIAYSDDISGDLTVNLGVMSYTNESAGQLGINIRYPVTGDSEQIRQALSKVAGFELQRFNDSKPHHVDEKHPLIQTLQHVYEEQTGEKAKLIAIGGGTYARSLDAGVAFGPLFPGRPDIAHQKDEYIVIEDLLKATAIYAQAIYELAK
ncbi:dipeptidase PepV [Bacillus sp. SA1-12]|uniref:dipeptidase PepV n=1 Tax=Bacillus sp. SA1-12 TaxID=1455638 RepID=UPI000626FD02|nr:dipeptidase PepV [Bacillus sp. SA1-12]KKI88826.1 dipeptidase PepV [Bacillus sp. SA1-12]